ncbi:MAG: methylthioribulose-1-phosphate dehydratase [Pirellulaceae bacterium]|nr:MAG: methylthioribulose-1-phosphate dehydratase [Pirellulaceae bacterium]
MAEPIVSAERSPRREVGDGEAGVDLLADCSEQIEALRQVGRYCYSRGWSLGTSSNYSVVLRRDPLELLITASGKDKGNLSKADFVRVDGQGRPVHPAQPRASAETLLHVVAARRPQVGAVLHTHSVWSTLLSDWCYEEGGLWLAGYEMLKGLAGISTHETAVWLPIFENSQDIPALARQVEQAFDNPDRPMRHGYLIRRHGLYTWGKDLVEARRHLEVLEFLLECAARQMGTRVGRVAGQPPGPCSS